MMKKVAFYLICFLIVSSLYAQADSFKVVGYLPHYRFQLRDQVEFDKLTHLNIAFANPNLAGDLDVGGEDIDPVVELAHQEGLKVLISLAGGYLAPDWAAAWEHHQKTENRSAFIHKIIQYLYDHKLQGVDHDLEWNHVGSNYSGFVLELKDSLDTHDFLLTAALPGTYRYPDISNEALAAFDFINMMVYDLTGSWDPDNPGPHSPYSFAVSAINYWAGQGVPTDRLTLGVPFYGKDFSQPDVPAFTYRTMVELNPDYAYLDQVGQKYYNGIPTIEAKTQLALDEVSGIMIWELGQDAFNEYSLLRAIDHIINGPSSVPQLPDADLQIYPNPVRDLLWVNHRAGGNLELSIFDLSGKKHIGQKVAGHLFSLDVSSLPAGFYALRLENGTETFITKLIKQ